MSVLGVLPLVLAILRIGAFWWVIGIVAIVLLLWLLRQTQPKLREERLELPTNVPYTESSPIADLMVGLLDPGVLALGEPQPELARMKLIEATDDMRGPRRLNDAMRYFAGSWAIGGGWAVDLLLGQPPRDEPAEVIVLRRDLSRLFEHVLGWRVSYAAAIGSTLEQPWAKRDEIPATVRELHVKPPQVDVLTLTIRLEEAEGGDWVCASDPRVRLPLSQAIRRGAEGWPCLAPELLLLRAALAGDRSEPQAAAIAGKLNDQQRAWLREALLTLDTGQAIRPLL